MLPACINSYFECRLTLLKVKCTGQSSRCDYTTFMNYYVDAIYCMRVKSGSTSLKGQPRCSLSSPHP